jgi:phosphatidylglycerol:prolipoprotein diacylglycerol transferase
MLEGMSEPTAGFVHHINPLLGEVFGVKLWYYGLTYSLGFLGIYLWSRQARQRLGWSRQQVYDLSILVALGVLLGGRIFEILFYEWAYYRQHPWQVLSYWRGGMATHGILLGGVVAVWLFSRVQGRGFLQIVEELAIPGAFLMGVGRIGNFIDGQIVGSITDVWWAVMFPCAEGFRHPVTLYDSLKNLLIIPLLLLVGRAFPPGRGMLLAHFVFWYGFGRLFVDIFREYPTQMLGIGTGQYFNLLMAVIGLALMTWSARRGRPSPAAQPRPGRREGTPGPHLDRGLPGVRDTAVRLSIRRLALTCLLLFPLVIPTDWTRGNRDTCEHETARVRLAEDERHRALLSLGGEQDLRPEELGNRRIA